MNDDEVRNFLTNEPNVAYLQEILINMLLLWRNFDIMDMIYVIGS